MSPDPCRDWHPCGRGHANSQDPCQFRIAHAPLGHCPAECPVSLSAADRRKRHSSQRPGGRRRYVHTIHSGLSSTPKPTFRPSPHPLDYAQVRSRCMRTLAKVRGKAVCVLQSRRNMPSDGRIRVSHTWIRNRQAIHRVTRVCQNSVEILRRILPGFGGTKTDPSPVFAMEARCARTAVSRPAK